MRIGLQFSYVISDDVTIDLPVCGEGLVLSDGATFTAGTLERVSLTLDHSAEIEAYGVQDRRMISMVFDDTPVTSLGEEGVTADMLYFTGVVFYAQAIAQLAAMTMWARCLWMMFQPRGWTGPQRKIT